MNFQSGDAGDLSVKALSRGSWPSSAHESRLWRDGVTSFSCSRTSPGLPLARNRVFRSRATAAPPSWRSCLPKPLLQRNEHLDVLGNVASKVQHQSPCMGNELRRPVHDLLQHRLDPSPLGRMTDRRDFAGEPQPPQQTQTVVSKRGQMKNGIVGVELARGQPLQIEVRLDSSEWNCSCMPWCA